MRATIVNESNQCEYVNHCEEDCLKTDTYALTERVILLFKCSVRSQHTP